MTPARPGLVAVDLSKHAPGMPGVREQYAVSMSPNPLDHPGIVASLRALGGWGADPYGHMERQERAEERRRRIAARGM